MKLTLGTVILLIVLLTMLNVKNVLAQSTPTPTAENKPPQSSNIVQTNIHSTILDEDRRVIIHLPRNYSEDTAQKHPVMYVLYISVGDKETDQMIGGFKKLVDVLKKNPKKQFRWVADYTPYAVHQDNALISTSKGLTEWGKYLKEVKK